MEYVYKIIENYLDVSEIDQYFDLWDDCIIHLLDNDLITMEQAEEAFNDKYLNELLEQLKIENDCYIEKVTYISYVTEEEKIIKKEFCKMKSYVPIVFNDSKTIVKVEREENKMVIEIEQDDKIIRLYFKDKKQLFETVFEVAEKIQPYLKGGE